MVANESTKFTHVSNLKIGTASGGGRLFVGGVETNVGAAANITGATTLTAANSGTTYYLNAAAGATVTLPALAAGLNFKFVVGAAFATTNWVIDSAEGDNIDGSIVVAGVVVIAAAEDQINFVASAETKGDYINIHSDGVQWFVDGMAAVTGGITATDPS